MYTPGCKGSGCSCTSWLQHQRYVAPNTSMTLAAALAVHFPPPTAPAASPGLLPPTGSEDYNYIKSYSMDFYWLLPNPIAQETLWHCIFCPL